MLFAAGKRPSGAEVRALAEGGAGFSVSLDRAGEGGDDGTHWLELLVSGLTYDLSGLSPGTAAGAPPMKHAFGIPHEAERGLEAVVLRPGPHLAAGATMIPVVRMLAWLTAQLALLPGLQGVVWHPARCLSAPAAFRSGVSRWTEGGPFPVFSLAALAETPDDALQSEGLALFTGQELWIAPALSGDRPAAAKIAVRLLHWLVEAGPVSAPQTVAGTKGERFVLEPSADGRIVRARAE